MDATVQGQVVRSLEVELNRMAEGRQIRIDAPVRSFVRDLVIESLNVRADEWLTKLKLNPDSSRDSDRIALHVAQIVREITEGAFVRKGPDDIPRLLMVGVVEQVHKRWCGIFPFCR